MNGSGGGATPLSGASSLGLRQFSLCVRIAASSGPLVRRLAGPAARSLRSRLSLHAAVQRPRDRCGAVRRKQCEQEHALSDRRRLHSRPFQRSEVGFSLFLPRRPVVPSIPDAILLSLLEKEKPAFSVVDVSRILDWCRSLQRPQEELTTLESLIRLLRERDETLRRCDLQNVASRDPVERRAGEPYVMPVVQVWMMVCVS